MPQSWLDSPLWNQLRAGMLQAVATVSTMSAASPVLLVLTLALMALAGALESPLLFLLAIVQAVVLFNARGVTGVSSTAMQAAAGKLWNRLPTTATVFHAASVCGTVVYRGAFRLAMCLAASVGAGLATLAWFVLSEAELWQWTTLQTDGPPLGPLLVSGAATLSVLLVSGWVACRTPLLNPTTDVSRSQN
ncbi:MAG TPA: hypothetical protein VM165_04990 [Planctomycetaceae bacterium]|nr:hypothetical protein [Planctomycetaceae bacterium]